MDVALANVVPANVKHMQKAKRIQLLILTPCSAELDSGDAVPANVVPTIVRRIRQAKTLQLLILTPCNAEAD